MGKKTWCYDTRFFKLSLRKRVFSFLDLREGGRVEYYLTLFDFS